MNMKDRAMLGTGAAAVLLLSGVIGVLAMQDAASDPFIGHALASSADAVAHAARHQHAHGKSAASEAMPNVALRGTASAPGGTVYTCPMHPNIVTAQPGSCPICGMHLVKGNVSQPRHEAASHVTIEVAEAAYRQLGVTVEVLDRHDVKPVTRTYAVLESDQGRATSATPKFEGWVKRLGVSAVGERVHRGQVLYDLYSADAQQRQRDYIDLLTRRDSLAGGGMAGVTQNNAMLASVAREIVRMRDRLREADIPPAVIARLETERRVTDVISVLAQADGVVTAINVKPGGFAGPNEAVLAYGDPRGTSASVVLYPDQLAQLNDGAQLTLTTEAVPGWRARVPLRITAAEVDAATRKARVRVALPTAPAALVAGAILNAEIEMRGATTLTAPRDAVLRTGHGSFVMVALGEGRFQPAEVTLGKEDAERVEIASGVAPGTAIAVNGQFLLGAEASLAATRQRLSGGAPAADVM